MITAFQRSGFQKTGFQIGDEDDLKGKVIRRRRTKVWTDEELGINPKPVKKEPPFDPAPILARAQGLVQRLAKVEEKLTQFEEKEVALILALIDDE